MASVRVAAHVRKNPKTGKIELVKEYIRQTGGESALRKKGVDVDALKRVAKKADQGQLTPAEFRAKFNSLKIAPTPSANVPSAADRKAAADSLGKAKKVFLTGDTKMVDGKKLYELTDGRWTDDPSKFTRLKPFGKIRLSDEEESLLTDEVMSLSALERLEYSSVVALGALERVPGKQNWLEEAGVGGLPKYIEQIAKSLHEKQGMTISRAIATAISRCKIWAAGGGGVKPDTQAKAAKAIAELKAKAAKAKANNKK